MDVDREADLRYAQWLEAGSILAFGLIVVEFLAYASGTLTPYVPLAELPRLWSLPLREYLVAAQVPSGWGWIALAEKGDYVNFIGIAVLAAVPIACYLRILRHYLRQHDRIYAAIAVGQVLVLLAAASGFIPGAH